MPTLVILMNCLGDEIHNYFRHIPELAQYTINYICTYENLHNPAILEDIRTCDILITNNIKSYPHLTYENLKTIVRPTCQICTIEFIRFSGYYPLAYTPSMFLAVYDESTQSSNYADYRDYSMPDEIIHRNFNNSLEHLKDLDNKSDIKFFDFFMKNHTHTELMRDNAHPTHVFIKHIVKEVLSFLHVQTSVNIDSLELEYTYCFKVRVRPVLNCVKQALGLTFDTRFVNMFNTIITIEEYYKFIYSAKVLDCYAVVERLFFKRGQPEYNIDIRCEARKDQRRQQRRLQRRNQ